MKKIVIEWGYFANAVMSGRECYVSIQSVDLEKNLFNFNIQFKDCGYVFGFNSTIGGMAKALGVDQIDIVMSNVRFK